jgi:hypothetical protein
MPINDKIRSRYVDKGNRGQGDPCHLRQGYAKPALFCMFLHWIEKAIEIVHPTLATHDLRQWDDSKPAIVALDDSMLCLHIMKIYQVDLSPTES